jgi:hypothetical protein
MKIGAVQFLNASLHYLIPESWMANFENNYFKEWHQYL